MVPPFMTVTPLFNFIQLKCLIVGVGFGSGYAYMEHHNISSTGLVRFGRAAWTISGIVVDYKKSLKGLTPEDDTYRTVLSEVHLRSAQSLYKMCCINGGCFIKVPS